MDKPRVLLTEHMAAASLLGILAAVGEPLPAWAGRPSDEPRTGRDPDKDAKMAAKLARRAARAKLDAAHPTQEADK